MYTHILVIKVTDSKNTVYMFNKVFIIKEKSRKVLDDSKL